MNNANNPQIPIHRYDQPTPPLTLRERVELEYGSHFIPFLKFLEKKLGHEYVIEMLQDFAYEWISEGAEELVKTKGKNDLSVFKELFSPANPGLMERLTVEVIEDTKDSFKINVTECIMAEVFRDADAAEFGSAALCCDVLLTRLVNPQIELQLDETLMQGYPCCKYHWTVKD